jgi:hypothetical protein
MGIGRLTLVVVDGERSVLARREEGVGGSPAARRSSERCCGGVVDDGEAPGTNGSSGGDSWRFLLPRRLHEPRRSNWVSTVGNVEQRVDEEGQRREGKLAV